MILSPVGTSSGILPQRRRTGLSGRRQTLGHNLLNGLVEWWPLSEQAGGRRGIHAGLDLTDNATVTGADGVGSLASQFTRANAEFLSRTSEAALQPGDTDFTWAVWARFDSAPAVGQARTLMSKWLLTGNQLEYGILWERIDDPTNRIKFSVSGDGSAFSTVVADVLGTPLIDTWYFIVAWHDATANTINITVNDGAADSVAHTTGAFASTADLNFGSLNGLGTYEHDGRIQRSGFWNRALSSDERTYLFHTTRGRDYPFN